MEKEDKPIKRRNRIDEKNTLKKEINIHSIGSQIFQRGGGRVGRGGWRKG